MDWTKTELAYLHKANGNKTAEQVAKHTGRSRSAVIQKARRESVKLLRGGTIPEKKVAKVKSLLAKTFLTHKEIGQKTGVSKSFVSAIACGRRQAPKIRKSSEKEVEWGIIKNTQQLNSVFGLREV